MRRRVLAVLTAVALSTGLVTPADAATYVSRVPPAGSLYAPALVYSLWHQSTRASEIYTLDPRTGRRTRVVSSDHLLIPQAWRASTGRIYYLDAPEPGQIADLFSVPARGGTPRYEDLKIDRYETAVDVSPDGKTFAYNTQNGRGGQQVALRTAGVDRVVQTDGENARFSPDARRIVFSRALNEYQPGQGDSAVFVMNADGSGVVRVTQFPVHNGDNGTVTAANGRLWKGGNRVLYDYSTNTSGGTSLYVSDLNGANKRLVARNGFDSDWASNGWLLYLTRDTGNGNLSHVAVRSPQAPYREYVVTTAEYDQGVHYRS